jgi:photosynthetic reaction center H subunit
MYNAQFAGGIDVAAVALLSFTLFFFGLILYLRREDRREGYPIEDDVTGHLEPAQGLLFVATPKTFLMPHGGTVSKPDGVRDAVDYKAERRHDISGSPLSPVGDPMKAAVGPGAFARRAAKADPMPDGSAKIVPLRVATDYWVAKGDPDPRGFTAVGADGQAAGVVVDIWVDRLEFLIRYLEVELTASSGTGLSVVGAAGKRVLLPMAMAVVRGGRGIVKVDAILGSQFAGVPTLENPDQITLLEEEQVCAYYGAGYLYATPQRSEPLI